MYPVLILWESFFTEIVMLLGLQQYKGYDVIKKTKKTQKVFK